MADISKITLPNGSQYDVKDAAIRPVFINFHSTGNHFWDEDYNFSEDNWWVFDSVTTTGGNVLTNEQFYQAYSNGAQVYLFMNSVVGGNNFYITIPLFSQTDELEAPSYNLIFRAQWYGTPDYTKSDTTLIIRVSTSSPYLNPYVKYIYPTSQESSHITYSNSWSGLSADNVQDAIDEISTVAGLTDTNISSPTEGQILHYDETNSKWVNDKTASGSFSIFSTTSEDAAVQVTGDASHQANIGVYNSLIPGTMHINMGTTGTKELVCYDANGNRSVAIAHDVNGNYSGAVFDAIPSDANEISYDNTTSGLSATDVQDAIDEVVTNHKVVYINMHMDSWHPRTAYEHIADVVYDSVTDKYGNTLTISQAKSLIETGTETYLNLTG